MLDTRMSITKRQELLQNEYDSVCSMLKYCYDKKETRGYEEYLWRKHEVERIADIIGIELLKIRDTKKLLNRV